MSGKYDVIKPLGQGSNASVYLARHLKLDAECAIKVSPKDQASVNQFLSEARLLKRLNHPGIPKIYDIDEDENYIFLVEEFIVGESLDSLFFHQSVISPDNFFSYVLQLCDIYIYLHSLPFGPLFYQDLKPEHVILCKDSIRLIDFCVNCDTGKSPNLTSGNCTYSAPEVLSKGELSVQADVYTLGKFIQFLSTHTDISSFPEIIPIIQNATSVEASLRFETVEELRDSISHIATKQVKRNSCKSISVLSSSHGSGATHIGISVCCTLNYLGISCNYEEHNDSDILRKMYNNGFPFIAKDGYLLYRNFSGLPLYGPGIQLTLSNADVLVKDFGVAKSTNVYSSDIILLIVNSAPWHMDSSMEFCSLLSSHKEKVRVICADGDRKRVRALSKKLGLPVYEFRDSSDAFCVTKEKIQFFKMLLNQ